MKNKATHCPQGHPYSGENLYISKDGHNCCRTCRVISMKKYKENNIEKIREWHKRNWLNGYRPDKEKSLEHTRKWKTENKEKDKAQHLLAYKIKRGEIKKQPCEVCGELKVDGHHEDYTKPLEVIWLCRQHHKDHHRKLKLLTNNEKKK